MERNILFIISSAIYITSNPLCYAKRRSFFSAEERAKQTVKTIKSIRTMVPDAKILLIELGLKRDLPFKIENMVDKYLYLGNRKISREASDSPFKGLGEAIGLYLGNTAIRKFQADYFFKISGRYYLNEDFDLNKWTADTYTGMKRFGGICTNLYGFPARLYDNWRYSLKASIPGLLRRQALEVEQYRHIEKPINLFESIGVSGNAAVSGQLKTL